jgi:hypothetical protein
MYQYVPRLCAPFAQFGLAIFRSVRPALRRNHELRQVLHGVAHTNDGGTRQIRSPNCGVGVRIEKHDVGRPVWCAVAAVSLLRHHVAHRPGLHRRQFFFGDGSGDGLGHLSWRTPRQSLLGLFGEAQKVRTRGWCVQTHGNPHFRIPKFRIRRGSPPPSHDTHEAVFAFDRRFETMPSQNLYLCIA